MIWTYILSTILAGVLWYLLKHTYIKVPVSWCKEDWRPFRPKRWQILALVAVWFIPALNMVLCFSLLLWIIIDFDTKFVIDNWFTRKWDKIKEWLNKEI